MKTPFGLILLGNASQPEVAEIFAAIRGLIATGETEPTESNTFFPDNLPIAVRLLNHDPKGAALSERICTQIVSQCELALIVPVISRHPGGRGEMNPLEPVNQSNQNMLAFVSRVLGGVPPERIADGTARFLGVNTNRNETLWNLVSGSLTEKHPAALGVYGAGKTEQSVFADYAALYVLHAIHRMVAEVSRTDYPATAMKARIFISHAKMDGIPLAASLRDQFVRMHFLTSFYDVDVIQPGEQKWLEILRRGVRESLLLVLRTNAFDHRPWCRQEVMWAEEFSRPIVIIDARTGLTHAPSALPYAACHAVMLHDGNTLRVFAVCLRELLREALAHFICRRARLPSGIYFLPRPPSLPALHHTLVKAESDAKTKGVGWPQPVRVVHAGPPLENGFRQAAESILRSIHPESKLQTISESQAELVSRLNRS
jgi:hypothetical protein